MTVLGEMGHEPWDDSPARALLPRVGELPEYVPASVRRRYRLPGSTCAHDEYQAACGACRFASLWHKLRPASSGSTEPLTQEGATS